ncbi:hypothetical protein QQ045_014656 [Rhodiola kirilowii]
MTKRSSVWDFFKKVTCSNPGPSGSVITEEMAECIFCKNTLQANSKSAGTSGLRYHIKHCKKNPANCQKTILSYAASEGKHGEETRGVLKNWNFDQNEVRKALSYMVMVDGLPFRFVEHTGFRYFMRVACPLFSIPSRWTVARDCYQLYEEERMKLKAFLKKSAQRVCLTTDTWTSIQRINYLCLTAHFIDDDWNLNKRILNFVPISSHRGEDIGLVIENCLIEWGIGDVFTVTVDNAGSNNTAISYLQEKLTDQNGCLLEGKYLHMRCIAHIINLVVVDGLKGMKDSISRIRNAVRYVRQSPSRWEKFKQSIVLAKIDSKSHVSLDVRTRWNSTYLMLESAVKFENAFERLNLLDPLYRLELSSRGKGKSPNDDNRDELNADCEENQNHDEDTAGVPTKTDWKHARRFVNFLYHFYTLTVRVSGSKYVTSNTFYTEISSVLYLLEKWQQDPDMELVDMATKMKQKYDKYWGNVKKMNMLIYIAVVLDPRYKLEYLQWSLYKIYKSGDKQAEELGELVKKAMYELFNEYMKINNCGAGARKEGSATSGLQPDVDGGKSGSGESELVSLFMMHKSNAHIEENRTELDTYLKEPIKNLDGEFNILALVGAF